MSPEVIGALVKSQAPEHAEHRAQELVSYDATDRTAVVQCACNVRLTLTVPKPVTDKTVEKQEGEGKRADKGVDRG